MLTDCDVSTVADLDSPRAVRSRDDQERNNTGWTARGDVSELAGVDSED